MSRYRHRSLMLRLLLNEFGHIQFLIETTEQRGDFRSQLSPSISISLRNKHQSNLTANNESLLFQPQFQCSIYLLERFNRTQTFKLQFNKNMEDCAAATESGGWGARRECG